MYRWHYWSMTPLVPRHQNVRFSPSPYFCSWQLLFLFPYLSSRAPAHLSSTIIFQFEFGSVNAGSVASVCVSLGYRRTRELLSNLHHSHIYLQCICLVAIHETGTKLRSSRLYELAGRPIIYVQYILKTVIKNFFFYECGNALIYYLK